MQQVQQQARTHVDPHTPRTVQAFTKLTQRLLSFSELARTSLLKQEPLTVKLVCLLSIAQFRLYKKSV
jgi:hypothetical protein